VFTVLERQHHIDAEPIHAEKEPLAINSSR
jgi:hypothetical protein